MPAQILIVDDSVHLRSSIRSCIERNTEWEVCGEAENGLIAIEKVRELNPDLVILDFAMPIMNGLDAARHITNFAPELPMLLFTLHSSVQLHKEALAAGIKDVLSKSEGETDQLLAAMRILLADAGIP
ncbi:MAG: response regulator [Candidatus Acidiferrum sp.]